jgi:soluble lytic murein transglycosylase-like protein
LRVAPSLRTALLQFAVATLCMLACVNGGVRVLGGGDPHWLSPLWVPEKVRALLALSAHALSHGEACDRASVPELVEQAARRHGVPVQLALSVARTESSFHAHAISRTGAMGLMQLMPGTADALGVRDAFDPTENTDGAARYLAQLTRRYRGDHLRAVAAYNLGPGRVPQSGPLALPGETRVYVQRVLGKRRIEKPPAVTASAAAL